MSFSLLPTIDMMLKLYSEERGINRFESYLKLLEGPVKGDLHLPLTGYNPMAREHVPALLEQLKAIDAEGIVAEELNRLDKEMRNRFELKVAINLADDLHGQWTEHYVSDYSSKFKLSAMLRRNFCVVYLWSTEKPDAELVRKRTREYVYRSVYGFNHTAPKTLAQHINQESHVIKYSQIQFEELDREKNRDLYLYFNKHGESEDYGLIFNFLYGDDICKQLGYTCYGIGPSLAGFRFASMRSPQD